MRGPRAQEDVRSGGPAGCHASALSPKQAFFRWSWGGGGAWWASKNELGAVQRPQKHRPAPSRPRGPGAGAHGSRGSRWASFLAAATGGSQAAASAGTGARRRLRARVRRGRGEGAGQRGGRHPPPSRRAGAPGPRQGRRDLRAPADRWPASCPGPGGGGQRAGRAALRGAGTPRSGKAKPPCMLAKRNPPTSRFIPPRASK